MTDPDILFAVGLLLGLCAFPALLSAFSQSRTPGAAMTLGFMSACLILAAQSQNPKGYSVDEAPDVLLSVIARLAS